LYHAGYLVAVHGVCEDELAMREGEHGQLAQLTDEQTHMVQALFGVFISQVLAAGRIRSLGKVSR
jgi:hypothetical protein